MSVNDLLRSGGVHLFEAPTLDSSREGLEFGLAKVRGEDLCCETVLVEDAEALARGEPGDDVLKILVGEHAMQLLREGRLASRGGLADR